MIISASYKTDIPAFYGAWFMNRLRAGFCKMVNPYGRQVYDVSLAQEDVDGFVFWTKNIGPFMSHLPEIRRLGYPFVVQHTITGYPRQLEARVVNCDRAVANMRALRESYGSEVAIWRYDPILITSLTPPDWHRENFTRLARQLRGATGEVVISFAQIYKKAERNMNAATHATPGFSWREHEQFAYDDERLAEAHALVRDLAQAAADNDMTLTLCSQKRFEVEGVQPARCIDAARLARIAQKPIDAKVKGNRPECACSASRDIGEYDTCPHGCIYCYAVRNRDLALTRYRRHNPESEFLYEPEPGLISPPGRAIARQPAMDKPRRARKTTESPSSPTEEAVAQGGLWEQPS